MYLLLINALAQAYRERSSSIAIDKPAHYNMYANKKLLFVNKNDHALISLAVLTIFLPAANGGSARAVCWWCHCVTQYEFDLVPVAAPFLQDFQRTVLFTQRSLCMEETKARVS